MKKWIIFGSVALVIVLAVMKMKQSDSPNSSTQSGQRYFHMGITFWPPDTDTAAILDNGEFVKKNEDLNVYQQLGGVPWVEAAQNSIPQRVMNDWKGYKNEFNSRRATYIALTPLNVERNSMANYADSTSDESPLPAPWSGYKLNDDAVKQAYLNYVLKAIDYFNPDYLAIDIETNQYYEDRPGSWQNMVDLHQYIYQQVKSSHPKIMIMPTIQYDHIKKANAAGNIKAINQLLQYADAVGLSSYPYSTTKYSLTDDYFDASLQFKKPVAIAETGFPSNTFKLFGQTFQYTQEDQAKYITLLMNFANKNHSPFVVLFNGTDFDKLVPHLPLALQEVSGGYQYDGLRDSSKNPKKAYDVWASFLKMKYSSK